MTHPQSNRGFTLIELLAVVAIVAVLAGLVALNFKSLQEMGFRAACINNLRQIGVGVQLYANDHNTELPGRARDVVEAKWPVVLVPYIESARLYSAPGRSDSAAARGEDPLSNSLNNTSFILNGFNDLGALETPGHVVRLVGLARPSEVILIGMPIPGSRHFYMDMLEGVGNHNDILDLKAYGNGSPYLFADGSARILSATDYDHKFWLVDRSFAVPPPM